jgi:hypothetical protein
MADKPTVFLAIRVRPESYVLSSLTANLGHIRPPMDCDDDLIAAVDPSLVTKDIEVRARLKSKRGPVTASLLAWSSTFEDDPETPIDERWKVIATTPAPTDKVIVLAGTFNPYQGRS